MAGGLTTQPFEHAAFEADCHKACAQFCAQLESAFLAQIAKIERRNVPADEIREHGLWCHWPDGRSEIRWKGRPIIRIEPAQPLTFWVMPLM